MFQDNFNHSVIRKYYAYFAALFANVYLDRYLPDGSISARIKVPLHFAKVEHAIERVLEDPTISRPDAIVLPAMSFDLVDMRYAGDRKQPTRNRVARPSTDPNSFSVMHAPVPYDFHFRLGVMVKNLEDGLKIVEGIAPYFSPDYTANLELIPEMGLNLDVPVVMSSCSMDFDVPADYKTRVTYVWVLDFVLQGSLYGPQKSWPVIKFSNVSFSTVDSNTSVLSITVQPGLTANGLPTSDPSQTVPYLTIAVTSDYGYVVQSNTHGT